MKTTSGRQMEEAEIRKNVRKGYSEIAKQRETACVPSCCGGNVAQKVSKAIGYSDDEIGSVPEGSNLGLGCGNPTALASLKEGETVLDLGSGAGFDCFLAAKKVGKRGRVIGVDMTPDMIDRARENARKGSYENVEFRLGEIENLPTGDNTVDVVISNCVINLSPNKGKVFSDAFRVLRPGGRMMVSDIVLLKELPAAIRESVAAYVGCISGAMPKADYVKAIKKAGFQGVEVVEEVSFPVEFMTNDPTVRAVMEQMKLSQAEIRGLASSVLSIKVQGLKPTH